MVPKDLKEAVRCYRLAAGQRHAEFQYNLSAYYANGDGVPKDPKDPKAARYYRLDADQGHVEAQYHLGFFYHNGFGVPKDLKEAVRWYRFASDQNHALAIEAIKEPIKSLL